MSEVIVAKPVLLVATILAESVPSLQEKYVTVLSDLELRSITDYQSEKVFENYIRVSLSEQAQRVGDKIRAAMEAKKQVDK